MSKLHKIVATTALVGTVAVGASQIADADNYTVKDGDTLWDIAVNNGTTVDALMQDNNLTSSLIRPGDQLTYSSSVERLAQAKNDGYYTITLGDTLGSVASKFGTTVESLVELNNLSDPHMVYVGQVIKVDAKASGEVVTTQAAPVQAAPVAQTRVVAAPVAQTRAVAAPVAQTRVVAAQTKAVAAPAAQTRAVAAPAAQTKAAVAPAAQTKAAVAPAAQTKAAVAPAAQTKAAVAPAAQTKAAVAPKAETKVATPTPAAQTKAAVAPKAETKVATPAPAAQTKAAVAPKAETKVATPAPAAQTKAAVAPKAETKVATPAPAAQTKAAVAPKAETKAATPAPAAQTKAATPAAQTKAATPATQTKAAATPAASGSKNAAIYQAALAQVGRYQDCTMLVTNALKSVGINYHDWPAGYMKLGTQVSASQAQAGDLIYYANGGTGLAHIAVYAGNGQAVHGGWLGNQTVVNSANVGSGQVYIRVK